MNRFDLKLELDHMIHEYNTAPNKLDQMLWAYEIMQFIAEHWLQIDIVIESDFKLLNDQISADLHA